MRDKHQVIEEPCEVKVSCTVLKTSGAGDSLAEFNEFYTDSKGETQANPRFYRVGEKRMKFYQRRVSRKQKGSANHKKAINKLGRTHLTHK